MGLITLGNDRLELTFDSKTAALLGLRCLQTGWEAIGRPELGLSFEMLVPTRASEQPWQHGGRRNNRVFGDQQPPAQVEVSPDCRHARFAWESLIDERGERLGVGLTLGVSLADEAAVFQCTINNQSPYVVENAIWPFLGDLRPPTGADFLELFAPGYSDPSRTSLWPMFRNQHGYFGVDHPSMLRKSAFCLLRSDREGLYFGRDCSENLPMLWHAELRPGYACAMRELVPRSDTLAGKPVAMRFGASQLPFIQPGQRRDLAPVALCPYEGSWQAGVDVHRNRRSYPRSARQPQWVNEPHAWLQIQMNSPEDELRFAFSELPDVAAECAAHGVKAIQLVGWNDGGQDQGNPSHDPDPRLGTPEELKQAIARCHELGVKVVLFAKFTWADQATPWFREELHRFAIKDPYGNYPIHSGYRYQTQTQLADVNTKRLVPMCFLSQEYLDLCRKEFRKMVDLGAAGILYDESQHHGPAYLCFDTSHGHRPGAYVHSNDNRLIENFSGDVDPEFLFAGEACYDQEFGVYHLAYFRTWNVNHIPFQRYLRPDAKLMTAITGFDDRNMINQCLLYGYVLSYEPYNFKGRLGDFPETVAYGQAMDALRTELREYLWDGEFRHELGASVTTAAGDPHHPYAVWKRRGDGRAAVAVANYEMEQAVTVEARLDDGTEFSRFRIVGEECWRSVEGGIELPPMSAAVILPGHAAWPQSRS